MSRHILLIESDQKLARLLELELSYETYRVSVVKDAIAGLVSARELQPDLILIDGATTNGWSGVEICQRLRLTGHAMPILLMSEKHEIRDRIAGLDAGADDYILKPFSLEELLARVRSHLRRHQRDPKTTVLQFDDVVLNQRLREVYRGKRLIQLSAKEFDLLEYLMIHPCQVISRQQILNSVWNYDFFGNSNVVEVYISHLRRKLETEQASRLIHTIRNVGYILRGDEFHPKFHPESSYAVKVENPSVI